MIVELDKDRSPSAAPKGNGAGFRAQIRSGLHRLLVPGLIAAGLLAFALVYFAPTMFVTIHSGQVGVLYLRFFGGTQTDHVLGEGLKVVMPWDHLFIYSTRVQEVKDEMNVLTKEGLQVKLYLSIRYHPEPDMVGMLQQKVGPDYRDRIVVPEVESAMRRIMGQFGMDEVYGSKRGLVQKVINQSLESISQEFVKVDEIVIRRVELPHQLETAIETKMTQKERVQAYEYKLKQAELEAKRLKIKADGLKQYNNILNSSLTPAILRWKGIEATEQLAKSPNAKTVIIGPKGSDLPVILGTGK
jgi:regulator of protease activity HflC (stomatin/prohibitin superfamily)